VVARSGDYKPNVPSLRNDFVVEGEQRYGVHVAIDRVTAANMTASNSLVLISIDQEPRPLEPFVMLPILPHKSKC
jgi:hypothetical protein